MNASGSHGIPAPVLRLAGLALAVTLLMPQQTAAVTPPPAGEATPLHVRQAEIEIAKSYGTGGLAARLREIKHQNRDQIVRGAAPAAATVVTSIPVILGNYSNVSHFFSAPQYAGLLFATAPNSLSMRKYYDEISGGQYLVTGSAYGPFTAAQTQAFYVNGDNGFGSDYPTNAGGFIKSVLTVIDTISVPPFGVAWENYDNDGPDGVPNSGDDDGMVDGVIFIVPDGDASGGDNDNMWAHQWDLVSSTGSMHTTNRARFGGGFIQINKYTIQGGEQGNGNVNLIKPIGVFCHEWGHILGLPDLYDYDNSSLGVGTWCLMGLGSWGVNWNSTTEHMPVHMNAWCLQDLGWVTPTEVTSLDSVGLLPGEVYKLWEDAYQGGRFFLVEYRDTTGFDQMLPSEGYLIWHCNEEVFFDNSVDSYRICDLEEADGLNEIDGKVDHMDQGDMYPWGQTSFTDATSPNSRDVFGASTGVDVTGYAMGPGKTIWIAMTPRALSGYTLYYNGHTWLGSWGFSVPQVNHGAVRFVAPAAGNLVSVQAGLFAGTPVNYSVRIFDDMVGSSPVNLHSTTAGTFPNVPSNRYHEITLSAFQALTAGDTFLVDVAWGPDDYAVPVVYRRPYSGQSYFSQTGASYSNLTDKDVAVRARIQFASFVCPVMMTGDVNADSSYTAQDVIGMVNYVFKSGAAPLPCPAAADVTCDTSVTATDVIFMVNHVFKSGTGPCDVCGLIQAAAWTCP